MKYEISKLPYITDIKKIFFVGIKGVGMTPLALIAKEAGLVIAGSDVDEIFITDKYLALKNIPISAGFEIYAVEKFFENCDISDSLIITTGAHKGFDNPQARWGKKRGILVLTQGQALALFMKGDIIDRTDLIGISIAGTHGKTTVTSHLSTTMKAMGLDPSYTIGSGEVFPLGAPGYLGRGEFFIAEADEYASEPIYDSIPKFLYQNPTYAVINNIDFDHPDLFENINQVVAAFEEFAYNVKSGGKLFVNGDDTYLKNFKNKIEKDIKIISFGTGNENDYVATKIVHSQGLSRFTVMRYGRELGVFEISFMGAENVKNSLPTIALLTELGFEAEKIRKCLSVFTGTKRRSELKGKTKDGAIVIDDYGHHPLAIASTIKSIKQASPGKKIICIFQPHTYSRTKALLSEFGTSFNDADTLLLLPIFKSARDTEKDTLSVEEYVDTFKKNMNAYFFENFSDVVEYVKQNCTSEEYIVVTMGAGDVYKIAEDLIEE